jgi:hypothetical protein
MRHSNSGFSAVIMIMLVAVAAVLVLSGLFVWAKVQNNSGDHQANKPSKTVTTQVDRLVIKEWQVQVPLAPEIKDAYYSFRPGASDLAYLSLTSLRYTDACAAEASAVGTYARFTKDEKVPGANQAFLDLYPDAPKIGNYYYYFTPAVGMCATELTARTLVHTARQSLAASLQSVEAWRE